MFTILVHFVFIVFASGQTVLGCEVGKYGQSCENNCSTGCLIGACDEFSGYCQCDGVLFGECRKCIDGKSGQTCDRKCSQYCEACDYLFSDRCFKCKDGYFGYDTLFDYYHCLYPCPDGCVCDGKTGNCLDCFDNCACSSRCATCAADGFCSSCLSGFYDIDKQCECQRDMCSDIFCQTCKSDRWYPQGDNSGVSAFGLGCCPCSFTCFDNRCEAFDNCTDGCLDGFYGQRCQTHCSKARENCAACISKGDRFTECFRCEQRYTLSNGYCISNELLSSSTPLNLYNTTTEVTTSAGSESKYTMASMIYAGIGGAFVMLVIVAAVLVVAAVFIRKRKQKDVHMANINNPANGSLKTKANTRSTQTTEPSHEYDDVSLRYEELSELSRDNGNGYNIATPSDRREADTVDV